MDDFIGLALMDLPKYEKVSERLRWARKNKGWTQRQLADELKLTHQAIEQVENNRTKKPTFLYEAAEELGVPYHWLAHGTHDESARQYNQRVLNPENSGLSELVPVYGYVAGSTDRVAINEAGIVEMRPRGHALERVKDGYYVAVIGDSMEPRLSQGEYLAVSPSHPPTKGKPCVVQFNNGEAVVKLFVGVTEKKVKVMQLNPKRDIEYDRKEIKSLAAGKGIEW